MNQHVNVQLMSFGGGYIHCAKPDALYYTTEGTLVELQIMSACSMCAVHV